jgi:hypothetical protein
LYHSVTSALVSLVKVSAKITGTENNSSAKRDTGFRRKQRQLTARRVRMPIPALRMTTTFCRPVERANACRNRFQQEYARKQQRLQQNPGAFAGYRENYAKSELKWGACHADPDKAGR